MRAEIETTVNAVSSKVEMLQENLGLEVSTVNRQISTLSQSVKQHDNALANLQQGSQAHTEYTAQLRSKQKETAKIIQRTFRSFGKDLASVLER